jgi:Family of unknown function (DUF5681)
VDTPGQSDKPVASGNRRKGAPRGKPFEPGNTVGKQFQPGESGNPSGRPKTPITDAYRDLMERVVEDDGDGNFDLNKLLARPGDTYAVAMAKAIAREAIIAGSIKAANEIANRLEGTPRQTVSGPDGGPVAIIFDVPRPDRQCTKE